MNTNYTGKVLLDDPKMNLNTLNLSTGIPELDHLLFKGFPKGKVHMFYGCNDPGGRRSSILTRLRIAQENFLRSPFAKLNLVQAQFYDISDQVLKIARDNLQSPLKSLFPVTSKTLKSMEIGVNA